MKITQFDINQIGNPNCSYTPEALIDVKEAFKKNMDDAEKYKILMGHTKYHNTFGCGYHFKYKEEARKNQFLRSEIQELQIDANKWNDFVKHNETEYSPPIQVTKEEFDRDIEKSKPYWLETVKQLTDYDLKRLWHNLNLLQDAVDSRMKMIDEELNSRGTKEDWPRR